jgi:hypothetical protein
VGQQEQLQTQHLPAKVGLHFGITNYTDILICRNGYGPFGSIAGYYYSKFPLFRNPVKPMGNFIGIALNPGKAAAKKIAVNKG